MYGERDLREPYPSQLYWIRYYEKLTKGYKDVTDIYLKEPILNKKNAQRKSLDEWLYDKLFSYANQRVNQSIIQKNVSKLQLEQCKKIYCQLLNISNQHGSLKEFNDVYLGLLQILPRKIGSVDDQLAHDISDFNRILDREYSLINSLKAIVLGNESFNHTFREKDILIHEPSITEYFEMIDLIDPSMRNQIQSIIMISPQKQQAIFQHYCNQKQIKQTQLLFHGSNNENWFSIIINSLLLPQHNHASKTGQSLGNGLYFANCSIKSSHYSSLDEYILGVFDVGLKNPYQIIDDDHNAYKPFTRKQLLLDGYDSIHYHRKHVKWADEIVAFTERSVCLKAIIFMKVK